MSAQLIFRNMLAVAILIVLIATLICFYKGLKDKNYAKAKILGMIYIFLNVLRLLLEHFNLYLYKTFKQEITNQGKQCNVIVDRGNTNTI